MTCHSPLRSSLYACAMAALCFMGAILFFACSDSKQANSSAQENSKKSSPNNATDWIVGQWRYSNRDGQPLDVSLYPDGSALSNQGGIGSWYYIDKRVYIVWMDGWTDTLKKYGLGYRQEGYAPGIATDFPPSNSSPAEKVDSTPAPLP